MWKAYLNLIYLLSQRLDPKINTSHILLIKQCNVCGRTLFSQTNFSSFSLIWAIFFLTLFLTHPFECVACLHWVHTSFFFYLFIDMPCEHVACLHRVHASFCHAFFGSWIFSLMAHPFWLHIFYSLYFCIAHISRDFGESSFRIHRVDGECVRVLDHRSTTSISLRVTKFDKTQ